MAETSVLWLIHPADGGAVPSGTRFWKELIREGRWVNARAGFTLEVDRERLGRWAERFAEMAAAGIRVPVPWGHSYDPRDNAGFVEAVEVRGGALWGLLDVPGRDDAERLGRTVRGVSVSINPHFVDGAGRDWGEVIEHVALTNYPVVAGQGGFVPAADGAPERAAVALELAPAAAEPAPAPPARNSALSNRLYQLELEQAEREVDEALRRGKFTRPAAEALRELIVVGIERRLAFDGAGGECWDVARLARKIIENTRPGAAVDMAEHTRVFAVPPPGGGMTDARATALARENRKLAGI